MKKNFILKIFEKLRPIKLVQTRENSKDGRMDSEGGKRFTTCTKCEKDRFNKRYRVNLIPQLISGFRKRAKKQSVPFNLTVDDMKDLIKNATDMCPALGVKMEITKLYANEPVIIRLPLTELILKRDTQKIT